MSSHELISLIMGGIGFVGIVAALLGKGRAVAGALIALFLLFGLSLWFPDPPTEVSQGLHWFPLSLAVLLLALPLLLLLLLVSASIRWLIRRI